MAISNKFGPMVLTTGNKSEMSVGYATLYGDMCGGYNVLKDVYKTEVFRLSQLAQSRSTNQARWAPQGRVIPERIITKPPTAELRANQTDQDSLPPYEILDGILECLVEKEMTFEEVVRQGLSPRHRQAHRAAALHLRIQAPPGAAGREDQRAQFRPRPALSDHQRVPGRAMTMTVLVRFAPSPTGLLHVGNARTAHAQLAVRAQGGRQVLPAHRRHRRRALASRNSKPRSSTTWTGWASPTISSPARSSAPTPTAPPPRS